MRGICHKTGCVLQELFDEYVKKKNAKKCENNQQIDASCLKWTPHVKRWNTKLPELSDCFIKLVVFNTEDASLAVSSKFIYMKSFVVILYSCR